MYVQCPRSATLERQLWLLLLFIIYDVDIMSAIFCDVKFRKPTVIKRETKYEITRRKPKSNASVVSGTRSLDANCLFSNIQTQGRWFFYFKLVMIRVITVCCAFCFSIVFTHQQSIQDSSTNASLLFLYF